MYKATSRQVSLWQAQTYIPDNARMRLEQSWAEGFQQHVFPVTWNGTRVV